MTTQLPSTLPHKLAHLEAMGITTIQRSQAPTLGIPTAALARWKRSGHLESVGDGGYVIRASPPPDEPPWEEFTRQHLMRARAVCDGLPGSFAIGLTAAMAHKLRPLEQPNAVFLSRQPVFRSRRAHVQARPPWGRGPSIGDVDTRGLRVQPVAECIVEVAATCGVKSGLVVANRALATRQTSAGELNDALENFGTRKGTADARSTVALADERIDRAIETLVFWIYHTAEITVLPQYEVHDAHGGWVARVDFLVEGTRVVIEADGLEKYRTSQDLRKEKIRELDIQRAGFIVLRFAWRDLKYPDRVRARIWEAMRASARLGV